MDIIDLIPSLRGEQVTNEKFEHCNPDEKGYTVMYKDGSTEWLPLGVVDSMHQTFVPSERARLMPSSSL